MALTDRLRAASLELAIRSLWASLSLVDALLALCRGALGLLLRAPALLRRAECISASLILKCSATRF